ncbi:MAG TPA: ATP-binding protein [Candidatus Angelobacter sp.]|nr:ATP-binding protein [Candidatus Angelobacter sp.]
MQSAKAIETNVLFARTETKTSTKARVPESGLFPRVADDADIRPAQLLGLLVACVPTALLVAARGSVHLLWLGASAHTVLCVAIAAATAVVGAWLGREAKLSSHPSISLLAANYCGIAILAGAQAFETSPVHLFLQTFATLLWVILCSGSAVILMSAASARRCIRTRLVTNPWHFYATLSLTFALLCVAMMLLDAPVFHSLERARIVRLGVLALAASALPVILVGSFVIYRRKRQPVILFFNLGLYLYALAVVAITAAPQWSLPWWGGLGLELISAFSVAYGVLEANRARDRLDLIGALAARSHELQKSHADLAHSELRYRSMVNNAPYGVFRLNHWERFEAINPALLDALGYEPMHPCTWLPSFAELFREREDYGNMIHELRRTGRSQREVFWKRKDGAPFKVRLQCRRVPGASNDSPWFEGIVEDLSEQSSLEEQLRQSQKMEAIGRLAGGIAHDFNNLLTIINGYTGMLIDTFSDSDPRQADAQRVKHAAQQAAALTRQLLAFSRKQVLSPTTLDLNNVVEDLAKILPRLLGEDVDLAFVPERKLSAICADRGQLEQVLMNLIVNSRDAMPNGGKITIETKSEFLDEKYSRSRGVIPGEYVMLAVTDTGCGMDAATQARIFEPFFTTKEEGKGTGLGLATAYGIVKQSGGHIAVYSEPGQGTTFKVYFPTAAATTQVEEENAATHHRPRGETILVVEDEESVRDMIAQALRRRAYKVIEASSGEEALELVGKGECDPQLLITDIVMPGIRGTETAQKLTSMVPGLSVLYMSGYTDNAMFHQRVLDAGACFLQKPFTLDVLDDKVIQALDSRSAMTV